MSIKFKGGYSRMTGCTTGNHPEYDRGFSNGQQSKQAEIDALQAKIEDLTKWAEFHIEDYNLSESESEHDRGWFNAACQVFKTLKENNNDT